MPKSHRGDYATNIYQYRSSLENERIIEEQESAVKQPPLSRPLSPRILDAGKRTPIIFSNPQVAKIIKKTLY